MKDDSLSDVQDDTRDLAYKAGFGDLYDKAVDPWIESKDDKWFMFNDVRIHRESWNAAIKAVAIELEKAYPYSAKELKVLREQMK